MQQGTITSILFPSFPDGSTGLSGYACSISVALRTISAHRRYQQNQHEVTSNGSRCSIVATTGSPRSPIGQDKIRHQRSRYSGVAQTRLRSRQRTIGTHLATEHADQRRQDQLPPASAALSAVRLHDNLSAPSSIITNRNNTMMAPA